MTQAHPAQPEPDTLGSLESLQQRARAGHARGFTVRELVAALWRRHGHAAAQAILAELGLEGAHGKRVETATALRAIDMGARAQAALAGVNFALQLSFSATAGSAGFKEAADLAGLQAHGIDPAQRALIDARFGQALEAHARTWPGVVSREAALGLLVETMKSLLGSDAAG